MAEENKGEEDLEALGLIAHSYDALFSIRKRLRKINDIDIPLRGGVSTNQIGVVVVVFILALILFGFIISPITRLLGVQLHPLITFGFLFGMPILAAQRAGTPMPYGKSINGTLASFLRFHLDDPVHRRGVPIPTPTRPSDKPILHYQREWVMAENFAPLVPGEADLSDKNTERRFNEAAVLDLQDWYDGRARLHVNEENEARAASRVKQDQATNHLRGSAVSVYIPENENENESKEDARVPHQ